MTISNGNQAPNQGAIPARPVFEILGAQILLLIAASLFQFQTGVFQPPLVAYLALFYAAFLPRLAIWLALMPILFLLNVLLVFVFRYLEQHGLPIGDTFVAILQTEAGEATDYLERSLSFSDWLASGLFALVAGYVAAFTKSRLSRLSAGLSPAKSALAVVYLLAAGIGIYFYSGLSQTASTAYAAVSRTYQNFSEELQAQQELKEKLGKLAWEHTPLQARTDGTMILVLGESTTRNHMGLYGYYRDTTPSLSKMADNLLVQQDSISPHTYTVQSLSRVLSSANFDDHKAFADAPSENVLSALESAGFKTFWYSNQNKYGIWDNMVSLLGQTADESLFIRKSFGKLYDFKSYDENLLPLLDQALADPAKKKFIVLHLYATHFDYCSFVPPAYAHFEKSGDIGKRFFGLAPDRSKSVNCYDDAVRYVDSILQRVIDKARQRKEPAVVAYLSDHGEDPDAGTAHEVPLHGGYHLEIPNIWYFNAQARSRFGSEIQAFRANADRPFKSADFYHTVLQLLTKASNAVNPDRSLFSTSYTPYSRTVSLSDDGKELVHYDEFGGGDKKDYYEKARANLATLRKQKPETWTKLWAHRVDTLGKLMQAKKMFSGVELDVVYDPARKRFFVHHPPAPSTGLDLESYLRASADKHTLGYWFDWKNANQANVAEALARLNQLDEQFAIRDRVVLEAPSDYSPSEHDPFATSGWHVSYYLPTKQVVGCAAAPSAACAALVDNLIERATRLKATYISFDYRAIGFVKRHAGRFAEFRWLSWDLSHNVMQHDMRQLPMDKGLVHLLVGYPTLYRY